MILYLIDCYTYNSALNFIHADKKQKNQCLPRNFNDRGRTRA